MAEKKFRPDPQQRALPTTRLEQRVLALFNSPAPISLTDINKRLNALSPECVKTSLGRLSAAGKVTRLVDKGRVIYQLNSEASHV